MVLTEIENAVLVAMALPYATEDRFWSKVRLHPEDCWEWQGTKDRGGYGSFSIGGKEYIAHRMAWRFAEGKIPKGLHVCHHCDNRGCVRPSHLFVGTRADNMRDMVAKGRNRPPNNRGERHGLHKLTEAQVLEIREATGSHGEIGRKFGVNATAVCRIKNRTRWGHL